MIFLLIKKIKNKNDIKYKNYKLKINKTRVLRSTQRTNGRSSRRCVMGEMSYSFHPQHQAVESDASVTRHSHCLGEWINQTITVLVHSSTLNIVSTERWQQEREDRSSILSPTLIHRRLRSTNGYLLTQSNINKYIIISRWMGDRKFMFDDGDDGRKRSCQTHDK